MATTVKTINELFYETIENITKDSNSWQSFLKCASLNYEKDFSDQLLIYAQKPNASICTDIATWNNVYNRYVNKNCPGIGLLTEINGYPRIRYVWDINDTHSMYGRSGKELKLWSVSKKYEKQLIDLICKNYSINNTNIDFVGLVNHFTNKLVEDNYIDFLNDLLDNKYNTRLESINNNTLENSYKRILKNSISFIIINRCGLDPTDKFLYTDFNDLSIFQDFDNITRLGTAISDISQKGLNEIYNILKKLRDNELLQIRTFENNKILDYAIDTKEKSEGRDLYADIIQEGRGLYTTKSHHKRQQTVQSGQIFNDETTISKEQQERNISSNVDEGNISRASNGDRRNLTKEIENNNEQYDVGIEYNRRNESKQPNEMGGSNEQYQKSSRGNNSEGNNLQLEVIKNADNGILFSSNKKYVYKSGDKVFLDSDEYEIIKVGIFDIELSNPKYSLIGRTMSIIDFETKIAENPANDYLIDNEKEEIQKDNYYGEYNDEIDLIEHILSKYKIDDINLQFDEDGNIVAKDDETIWKGIELYNFLFDDLFDYNDDGTVNLINNQDLERLKEYKKKYNIEQQSTNSVEEKFSKEETVDTSVTETSQLSFFASREKEFADRMVDIFNSLDTKYKATFYINNIDLEKWDHIKSKKRHLTITLKSSKCTGYNETSFTQFNSNKDDEIILRESVSTDPLLKYLCNDKDFSISLSPDMIFIFYQNFDSKNIDLALGKDNILSSVNDEKNIEVIDNPKIKLLPKVPKIRAKQVLNYVLHPEIPVEDRINYKIINDNLGVGKPKERYKNNIEAIKVLKKCEEENRYATSEEQEILSKYVGWGGLSEAFDETKWGNEYKELKESLTPSEYKEARDTVLTAFYTPPIVIKSMYKALENMGLKKGNILEPSCGIGNFMGLLPNNDKLKIYGVEKDGLSGRIARQLYQKSSILIQGFEKVDYSNSFFDVAVGNVPFGTEKLIDKKYDKYNFLIHDYFFAKTLDKVRPGGIIAFITSKGTLDKESIDFRKYLAQRADLLGAIRLPNNTFKDSAGTEVTSDIIFLQKRDSIIDILPDWVKTGIAENGIKMNNYFINNPNMILGKMEMVSSQYGRLESTCKPHEDKDLSNLLDNAITNIHAEIKDYQIEEEIDREDVSIEADLGVKNFSYTILDDKVYYRENSRMYPQQFSDTSEKRVKGLIELRDTTRKLLDLQLEDYPDEEIEKQQELLNSIYDKFTKKYGLINSRTNSQVFSNDNSYFLLCSLEILDEDRNLSRKADIFTKRTINARQKDRVIKNANDALLVSLSDKAKVDISYMQSLCKMDMDKMLEELKGKIFRVPEYGNSNNWVTADEYLSGNVREKLEIAKKFAENDSDFKVNVEYLERAIPKDILPTEITVRLGATWIPEEDITNFMFELLDSSYDAIYNMKVRYSELTGEWGIDNKYYDKDTVAVKTTYGTNRANAYRLLQDALNLRDTKIFDYVIDEDGKKKAILNKKETAIAQSKQDKIKQAFNDWIWKDPNRRERLTRLYNEKFNSIRTRDYDGSNIVFEGMNPEITLRSHQKNAIARILYGGNTLLAHEVGAGKTFTMVAAAMESKRLGLCNKSLFVVPNHIIEQFASEFLQLYPSANILVATKKDFETKNRKKFCSRIATGDYDAIIIGNSQFEKIPMSVERQVGILENQLEEISQGIIDLKRNDGEKLSIKMLVKTQKSIERKLEKLNNRDKKDDVITFEQLGVDRLFVDEAHYYKNLYLYTKMRSVGGLAQTEAQKSSDLFLKCRYLDELTGSKGVIFATGTPISNSMAELYTMQRYLQYEELLKNNLQHFDAWASTFGETVTAIEIAPEGDGYRSKTRFAKFYNLPELMTMFREVADIQTEETLKLPVPKTNYINEVVKPSDVQLELVKSFGERAEKVRNKSVSPKQDNMLKITNDGRRLALDQRLINENLPDYENSKVSKCIENVYRIWEENKDKKLTQLIFCDLSTPKGDGTFNVYDDMKKKLIEKGVPEEEFSFIHDANTEVKKKELFSKVRKGQVRNLMGSTQKMGAGTNCQDKLIALHDLDCPWRPSDLIQRHGRIRRQGNQNEEVFIYRYVTEKTFDAYLYQLVENKQKFISQIMTSKTPVREAEDIDEVALSYAEIKALAAGNPLILEKTELDTEVAKLKLLKQSHLSEQYDLEDKVNKHYPNRIKELESLITNYKKDIEFLENHFPFNENFYPMLIHDSEYIDKKEAGKQLLEECKKSVNLEESTEIGEYKGFKMELKFNSLTKEFAVFLKNNNIYFVILGESDIGNITRIDNELDSITGKLLSTENKLNQTKEQLEKAKLEIGKPFLQEEELKKKEKRLNQLNRQLNIDEKIHEVIEEDHEIITEKQVKRDDYDR